MRDNVLRAMIFPMAIWLRLTGVTSMVANVPRSFSPAIDSGATAMQPENRNTSTSMGPIIENIIPVTSLSVARSPSRGLPIWNQPSEGCWKSSSVAENS